MNQDNWPGLALSSSGNQKIKDDIKLKNRRQRDATGLLSVEGFREVRTAIEGGLSPVRLYYCPQLIKPGEENLLRKLPLGSAPDRELRFELLRINQSLMQKLSYRNNPDAWFAVFRQPEWSLAKLPEPGADELYLIAESIEKPGNIGAILRSAEACGVAGMIVCGRGTDMANPNVVRASKGVSLFFPVAQCSNEEAAHWLRARNIGCILADPSQTGNLWEAGLSGKLALVLGAEHEGLSDFWRNQEHISLSIPMTGRVNSLNVAQAAGIIMFEIMRRRLS